MGLRIFFRDRIDSAAKTEFGILYEYFCGIEVGLMIFLSEEKKEEKLNLEIFCPKKRKGVGLKLICPSEREKEGKVEEVRRGVRSPVP